MTPPRSALRAPATPSQSSGGSPGERVCAGRPARPCSPPQGGDTNGPAEPDPRCSLGSELQSAQVGVASGARRWAEADGEHIDVRGLEPPQPLVAILQLVDSLGDAGVVIVHHDRDPLLLYPELAERGWTARALAAPPGEVRLRLARKV